MPDTRFDVWLTSSSMGSWRPRSDRGPAWRPADGDHHGHRDLEASQPRRAQVLVVGTGLGTRTGSNGQYTIVNVPAASYRVRVQMIGHRPVDQSVTVTAGSSVTQDFVLKAQALALDAMVVTGTAGAARNREVGNSISQIDMSKVQMPPANVGQLLQGQSAGMTVMPSSAMAGSGSMIRLRGNVSVTMSNQPLIYVDGVRIRSDGYQHNAPPTGSNLRSGNDIASPLNDINPNDIDRVEIIKGAAAATLYGTEAAAGVIQIFTKNGRTGRPQWTLSVDQGYVQSLPFGPDMSRAPPSDSIYGCATITPTCNGTIRLYRQLPDRFAAPRPGRVARWWDVPLPVHRSLAPERTAAALLALGGGGGESLRYFVSGTTSTRRGSCQTTRKSASPSGATSRSCQSRTCSSPGTPRTRRTGTRTRRPETMRTD